MLRIFDKLKQTGHNGYTLAEMLIVLLIISLVMLALPRATKKLFAVTTKLGDNGRMECYYDPSSPNTLVNYYVSSTGQKYTHTCDTTASSCTAHFVKKTIGTDTRYGCVWEPPRNAVYMALHAVGGGGSGAWPLVPSGSGYTTIPTAGFVAKSSSVSADRRDKKWPLWLSNLYGSVVDPLSDSSLNPQQKGLRDMFKGFDATKPEKNFIEIKSVWYTKILHYATSGKAGKVVSMYFPQLPNGATLYVFPGKGGAVSSTSASSAESFNGIDGQKTEIYAHKSAGSEDLLLSARGGKGAVVYDTTLNESLDAFITPDILDTTDAYDGGLKDEQVIKKRASEFLSLLADKSGKTDSKLAAFYSGSSTYIAPGDSGWGSYNLNNISNTQRLFYVNDYVERANKEVPGKGVITKIAGNKWSNVSLYTTYPSTCSPAKSNLSSANVTVMYYGTCRTYSNKVTCTIGNTTDMDDKTCAMSPTRSYANNHFRYFFGGTGNQIKQENYCAVFDAAYNTNAKYNDLSIARCKTQAGDGNNEHCKVTKTTTYYDSLGSGKYRFYPYDSATDTGCYYDGQIGKLESGKIVGSSNDVGSLVCKLPPDIYTSPVDYLNCTISTPSYTCPQGSSATGTGICKPTEGGNGAVVLLW